LNTINQLNNKLVKPLLSEREANIRVLTQVMKSSTSNKIMSKHRLQKIISEADFCSRRKAELLILRNKVFVNGLKANIGDKADPKIDTISINGYRIQKEVSRKVILLNKPPGLISSCYDQYGRKTVSAFLPEQHRKGMYPIGRLDFHSRGALIITNNGELTLKLTHTKYKLIKTFLAWINCIPSLDQLSDWESGIDVEGKRTIPAKVKLIKISNDKNLLEVKINEERNRQIRKVAFNFGYKVVDLNRISIANIDLKNLEERQWRKLSESEWLPIMEKGQINN